MATAVLVAFATAARPAPRSAPAAPRAWAVAAGPYVGALLAGIADIEPGPSAPPAADPAPGSGWKARLGPTAAAARRLPAPPSPQWAAEWRGALAAISSALTTADPSETRSDLSIADGDLLALSRSIAALSGP